MPKLKSAAALITKYWKRTRVRCLPGLSERKIRAFERSHKFQLPEDFREYLRTTNGTVVLGTDGCDKQIYCLWPIEDYEVAGVGTGVAIVFADYCMSSWWFALYLVNGASAVILLPARGQALVVARSFLEFAELYIVDSPRLYPTEARSFSRRHSRGLHLTELKRNLGRLYDLL
jgi:hypothetical protein